MNGALSTIIENADHQNWSCITAEGDTMTAYITSKRLPNIEPMSLAIYLPALKWESLIKLYFLLLSKKEKEKKPPTFGLFFFI